MPIRIRHQETIRTITDIIIDLAGTVSGITDFALARRVRGFAPRNASLAATIRRANIPRAIKRAERRGLVTVYERAHRPPIIRVTEKGRRSLARRQLRGCAVERPKRWDGRWRIVMFDVPETNRPNRERLRTTLRAFGFTPLQRSVWLYPYDCRDLVTLTRTAYGMEHVTVRYLVVSELEEDDAFRRRYDI